MAAEPIIYHGPDGEAMALRCDYCFAIALGVAPHGVGNPCPLRVSVDEAYIAKLDAERMAFIRSGGGVDRMTGAIEKMAGIGEDD